MESVEPGLPSECDCALCGPTDHIKWETLPNMMASTRSGAKYIDRSTIYISLKQGLLV